MQQDTGVTTTTIFGVKRVLLRDDGTVIVSGGESSGQGLAAPSDTAGQIEQLATLNANGVLTGDEFAAAKQKILGI